MSGPADPTDVVARIREVRFTPVRLREGYSMDDVDQLLDELADASSQGRPLAPLVAAARFTPVRMREGYDMGEVDGFLAELADGPPAPSVGPAVDRPTVVEEQRGLLSRLLGRGR